jgi:mannose-1-phosphate guanylyltransferase
MGELAIHLPDAAAGLAKIGQAWDTPNAQSVLGQVYPTLTKKSIDYAVMEPASQNKGKAHVVVVEMPVQWLDVGSWPALADTIPTDDHDNSVDAKVAVLVDSFNNIVVSHDPDHVVSLLGVSDMIVIHTPDATLVCPKSEDQRVKELVDKLKEKTGDRYQ